MVQLFWLNFILIAHYYFNFLFLLLLAHYVFIYILRFSLFLVLRIWVIIILIDLKLYQKLFFLHSSLIVLIIPDQRVIFTQNAFVALVTFGHSKLWRVWALCILAKVVYRLITQARPLWPLLLALVPSNGLLYFILFHY